MDYNAPPNSWTFGKAQQEFELSSGLSNSFDKLSNYNDRKIVPATIWLLREDHIMMKNFFENENSTYFRPNRKCKLHSAPCDEFDFVNRFESQEQEYWLWTYIATRQQNR